MLSEISSPNSYCFKVGNNFDSNIHELAGGFGVFHLQKLSRQGYVTHT
jgi:hypothetical protein